jgi:pyrroline-5-carboxylate reductase
VRDEQKASPGSIQQSAIAEKEQSMSSFTVAFLGAGRMSEAWIERLIQSGAVPAAQIMACDPSSERLAYMSGRYEGLNTTTANEDGARFGDFVVISTPPPDVIPALAKIRPLLQEGAIVISLAAGVPLQKIVSTATGIPALRVMPNTPSMVGEAMSLVCYPPSAGEDVRHRVEALLNTFGKSLVIDESEMEAYGALCSVGPTFLFPILQSMIDSAVEAGLREPMARAAAAQVSIGVGQLLAQSGRTAVEHNGMIGIHTLAEPEAKQLIANAYKEALGKLKGLAAKMSAGA